VKVQRVLEAEHRQVADLLCREVEYWQIDFGSDSKQQDVEEGACLEQLCQYVGRLDTYPSRHRSLGAGSTLVRYIDSSLLRATR